MDGITSQEDLSGRTLDMPYKSLYFTGQYGHLPDFFLPFLQARTQVQTCTARNTANNLCFDCEQASTFTASFTFGF